MADLLFVAIVIAFFGLMVLLVKGCDRIIGPDLTTANVSDDVAAPAEPEAPVEEVSIP